MWMTSFRGEGAAALTPPLRGRRVTCGSPQTTLGVTHGAVTHHSPAAAAPLPGGAHTHRVILYSNAQGGGLCVCVRGCVCACIHLCVCVCVCVCLHLCACLLMCVCVCVCVCLLMCVYNYVHMRMCVCMCVCVCVYLCVCACVSVCVSPFMCVYVCVY